MPRQQSAAPAVFIIVAFVCLQAVGASLLAARASTIGFILVWSISALLQSLCLVLIWYGLRLQLVTSNRLKRIEDKLGIGKQTKTPEGTAE